MHGLAPTLTIKEVPAPALNMCRSGHCAPKTFPRNGNKDEPTRFYSVSGGAGSKVNGVYCEICLITANAMSRGEVGINE